MRRLILSDVHANLEALNAVLNHETFDEVHCIGDLVGYGPDPRACLEHASTWKTYLQGNHELYVRDLISNQNLKDYEIRGKGAMAGLFWTVRNILNDNTKLNEEHIDIIKNNRSTLHKCSPLKYTQHIVNKASKSEGLEHDQLMKLLKLYSLTPQKTIPTKLGKMWLIHDNPFNPGDTSYLNQEDIEDIFLMWENRWPQIRFIVYGHTHEPVLEERDGRVLINPGSVGFPRCFPYEAHYAIFDDENSSEPFKIHHIPFDYLITQTKMEEAGLPKKIQDDLFRFCGIKL